MIEMILGYTRQTRADICTLHVSINLFVLPVPKGLAMVLDLLDIRDVDSRGEDGE